MVDPKLFKSLRTTLRYNTDWLQWYLTKNACVPMEKSWLIMPEDCEDMNLSKRIVMVAHIDTVHDGARAGFTKREQVEVASEGTPNFRIKKVAEVHGKDLNHVNTMLAGKPEYIRKIAGTEYFCWPTKRGEWRCKPGERADAFMWYEGWSEMHGKTTRDDRCAGVKPGVNSITRHGTFKSPYEDDWLTGKKKKEWVEVEAEPEKYHGRTILYDQHKKIFWCPTGLGGDDRCGVWAAFKIYRELSGSGHQPAILLCDYEEKGGQGAKEACSKMELWLADVACFIEFDRKGSNDAVFYNGEPKKWRNLWNKAGFDDARGTFSDVAYLGREYKRCTVNIASGYYNHHSTAEHVLKKQLTSNIRRVLDSVPAIVKHGRWHNKGAPATTAAKRSYHGSGDYDDYGWAYGAEGGYRGSVQSRGPNTRVPTYKCTECSEVYYTKKASGLCWRCEDKKDPNIIWCSRCDTRLYTDESKKLKLCGRCSAPSSNPPNRNTSPSNGKDKESKPTCSVCETELVNPGDKRAGIHYDCEMKELRSGNNVHDWSTDGWCNACGAHLSHYGQTCECKRNHIVDGRGETWDYADDKTVIHLGFWDKKGGLVRFGSPMLLKDGKKQHYVRFHGMYKDTVYPEEPCGPKCKQCMSMGILAAGGLETVGDIIKQLKLHDGGYAITSALRYYCADCSLYFSDDIKRESTNGVCACGQLALDLRKEGDSNECTKHT